MSSPAPPPTARSPQPLFLALGRLPAKRLDVLLRLWDQVRPVTGGQLVIAGDGPERARLRRWPGPGVEFAGRVSEAGEAPPAERGLAAAAPGDDRGLGHRGHGGRGPGHPGPRLPRRRPAGLGPRRPDGPAGRQRDRVRRGVGGADRGPPGPGRSSGRPPGGARSSCTGPRRSTASARSPTRPSARPSLPALAGPPRRVARFHEHPDTQESRSARPGPGPRQAGMLAGCWGMWPGRNHRGRGVRGRFALAVAAEPAPRSSGRLVVRRPAPGPARGLPVVHGGSTCPPRRVADVVIMSELISTSSTPTRPSTRSAVSCGPVAAAAVHAEPGRMVHRGLVAGIQPVFSESSLRGITADLGHVIVGPAPVHQAALASS